VPVNAAAECQRVGLIHDQPSATVTIYTIKLLKTSISGFINLIDCFIFHEFRVSGFLLGQFISFCLPFFLFVKSVLHLLHRLFNSEFSYSNLIFIIRKSRSFDDVVFCYEIVFVIYCQICFSCFAALKKLEVDRILY